MVGRQGRLPLRSSYYVAALLFFAAALMSKPMAVTLPFVLLLLDYWPLRPTDGRRRSCWLLVAEKIPFFVFSAIACVVTFLVQREGGAVRALENFSVGARIENALVSYARYLGNTVWPVDLAVFYPHPGGWPMATVLAAGALLVAVTVLVFRCRRAHPFAVVGWAWFVGMLVPVIGLVQVGGQAMADRYTYLPSIGLFIVAAWGLHAVWARLRWPSFSLGAIAAVAVAACAVSTRGQLPHWRDSERLFQHALSVTEKNYLAHNNLAGVLIDRGDIEGAILHARRALAIRPGYADAHSNLGQALLARGDVAAAVESLRHAVRLAPAEADLHTNLGNALLRQGEPDAAIACYEQALKRHSDDAKTHNNLGWAHFLAGRRDEADAALRRAIALQPAYANAHYNLAAVRAQAGKLPEAIELLRRAAEIYAADGEMAEALSCLERGVQLAGQQADAALRESVRAQLTAYRERFTPQEP